MYVTLYVTCMSHFFKFVVMIHISLSKSEHSARKLTYPTEDQYDLLVDEDTVIIDNETQKPVIVYLKSFNRIDLVKDLIFDEGVPPKNITIDQRASNEFQEIYDYVNQIRKALFPEHQQLPVNDVYYMANVSKAYHHDSVPLPGSLSTTLSMRRGSSGGYLVIPEYRIAFAQSHGSLCMFNGRELLHGVTKIKHHGKDAYRAVLVFYRSKLTVT